jgi:hypothetical protein
MTYSEAYSVEADLRRIMAKILFQMDQGWHYPWDLGYNCLIEFGPEHNPPSGWTSASCRTPKERK